MDNLKIGFITVFVVVFVIDLFLKQPKQIPDVYSILLQKQSKTHKIDSFFHDCTIHHQYNTTTPQQQQSTTTMEDSWDNVVVVTPLAKLQDWNLDSWDVEIPETETESTTHTEPTAPAPTETTPEIVRNPCDKYPLLLASMETTVLKTMYPNSAQPLQTLKTNIHNQLVEYILCVRNVYVMPLYYVLRSTRFFNPISKTRIHRKKNEYIDPDFKWVSLEDQRKVYQLIGLTGTNHSQIFDDNLRNELQEVLKEILFQPTGIAIKQLIVSLMYRMHINVDASLLQEIEQICQGLSKRPEFSHKSYKLPEKWYYNISWKKNQQHNEPMILGGEGGRMMVEQLIANF